MDQTEDQVQSLNICHRIFHFITKTLTVYAMKPVTLGDPRTNPSYSLPDRGCTADDQPSTGTTERPDLHAISENQPKPDSESVILVELVEFDATNSINSPLVLGLKAKESAPDAPIQKRAVKKMVSINDEAEIMDMGNKRRKLVLKKQTSIALGNEDSVEPKPLKSILRVGSSLR